MSGPSTVRGMPLISSPAPSPPGPGESHCKRCNKEFNMLFSRPKRCNHCGHAYCSTCCDHQALCQRGGEYRGYDVLPVCAYCIEMLSITASGRTQLRSMAISKLRNYLESYNIQPKSVLEKDDLVDAILEAKGDNGCLSLEQEAYYRQETVSKRAQVEPRSRNPFSRSNQSNSGSGPPPRPPPRPAQQDAPFPGSPGHSPPSVGPTTPPNPPHSQRPSSQQSRRYRPPPGPPPGHPPHVYNRNYQNQGSTSPPPPPPRLPRSRSPPPPNHNLRSPQPPPRPRSVPPEMPSSPRPRPQPQPAHHTRPSHAAPPPLSELLNTPKENIAQLSIRILKGILEANHVNTRLVLEKSELVDKVWNLVEVEKRDRERERLIDEREEQEAIRRQEEMLEMFRRQQMERDSAASPSANRPNGDASANEEKAREKEKEEKAKPAATFALDREGLCVVCQDEEANVAIVDCGHLALCMACSEIIMTSTKECPLCRTRIVTEQRLLRIFRT